MNQRSSNNARRDRVSHHLHDLRTALSLDPNTSHTVMDQELTKELKTIRKEDIGPLPESSYFLNFPVWETIATAAAYASAAHLWEIPFVNRIQNYLPNNNPDFLEKFRKEWEEIRLKEDTDAVDLLVLLLNVNANKRATFRTMVKKSK